MDAQNPSSTVTFANRTPLRIGAVGLKARDLSRLTDFYTQAIGLNVLDRDSKTARLGAGGVTLLELEAAPDATAGRSAHRRALSHGVPAADARRSRALAGACGAQSRAALRRVRPPGERGDLPGRSGRQRHRGLSRPAAGGMALDRRPHPDGNRSARSRQSRGSTPATRPMRARRTACASDISICASATLRPRSNSTAMWSASIRPRAAAARCSCHRGAIIITSAAMSGIRPAPESATTIARGLRGSRSRPPMQRRAMPRSRG